MCTVAQEALNNLTAVSAVSSRVATSRRRAVTAGTSVEPVSGSGVPGGAGSVTAVRFLNKKGQEIIVCSCMTQGGCSCSAGKSRGVG